MNCSKIFSIAVIAVIAAIAVLSANKASAVPGAFTVSATATFEQDTIVSPGNDTFTQVKKSFKNADALALLQTAVQNAAFPEDVSWFTTKGSTLVYDPDFTNLEASVFYENQVFGAFWVTNKTLQKGFRLDGNDGLGNYFSFAEFDFAPLAQGFTFGGELNQNGVSSGKYVTSPYQYTAKMIGNGTFYIHDNSSDFDYPENLDSVVMDNNFAVVLTGPVSYSFSYTFNAKTGSYQAKNSFSMSGSGDGIWNDSSLSDAGFSIQPVFSGSVKSSDAGPEIQDEAFFPDPLE